MSTVQACILAYVPTAKKNVLLKKVFCKYLKITGAPVFLYYSLLLVGLYLIQSRVNL